MAAKSLIAWAPAYLAFFRTSPKPFIYSSRFSGATCWITISWTIASSSRCRSMNQAGGAVVGEARLGASGFGGVERVRAGRDNREGYRHAVTWMKTVAGDFGD